jgi:hypothetical protein
MHRILFVGFLFTFLFPIGCKSNHKSKKLYSVSKQKLIFLDSTDAAKAIVERDVDNLFEQLSSADISIQMKRQNGFRSAVEARQNYKSFLRQEVSSFSEEEKNYMNQVFQTVNNRLKSINPNLILPEITLLKIKTNHYGEDVYYTRGRMICLPANTLKGRGIEGQANVMLHELWHILSRYETDLRKDAYALIGFVPLNKSVHIPKSIKDRILTNPDGVKMDFGIDLGDSITAIPLLISKFEKWQPSVTRFFDYIEFDLFALDNVGNVLTTRHGKTTIPNKNNAVFFEKIKDNTQYIIHPDEIMADNFMLAVNAFYNNNYDKYSKEGKLLLENLTKLLQKF